jgi:uncharacterized membrane protein YidH (DUF202 family)
MMEILSTVSGAMAPYLTPISVAMVATALSIFSGDIHRQFKRITRGTHFVVRFGLYVLLCAFGFGAVTVIGAAIVRRILHDIDRPLLAPVVVVCFLAIGLLAERKNHV